MNPRTQTMYNRIKDDFPEFVEMFPPNEKNDGLYRRIRHVQKTGECCGVKMTNDELRAIIHLCKSDTVKCPFAYLITILGRYRVEQTLANVRASLEMGKSEQIRAVAKYVAGITKWQLKTAYNLMRGKYSMNDVVIMCEICAKKEKPAAYLLGILRRGYHACAS